MNPDYRKGNEKEKEYVYVVVIDYYINGEKDRYCLVYKELDRAKCELRYQYREFLSDYEKLINRGRYISETNLFDSPEIRDSSSNYEFSIYEKDNYANNHMHGYIVKSEIIER